MLHELHLPRDTNQVRGLARYAIDFLGGKYPAPELGVLRRVERFFIDSVICGVSALAQKTNAPTVLRAEALEYPAADPARGAALFGSPIRVAPEKAILANCAAVREWDSNGTNFGYDPIRGNTAGEFGHNDYYPVVVAAAQRRRWTGEQLLSGMLLLDEIRGRLAEVFSLKSHKIDHVVHGAIASAVVYGAVLGGTVEQIESAVGMFVAHFVPFRAIRHGHQLSDSKGASAAFSAEAAVQCVHRALRGFIGPADIFRNPEAIFCLFGGAKNNSNAEMHRGIDVPRSGTNDHPSPFDLTVATGGSDFAVMGMHFKLGLYEHQSAGALQGLLDLLAREPRLLDNPAYIESIAVTIYEPAYSIICDPHKWDPQTRQSADHSLPYILATLLRKAFERNSADWQQLMLLPNDYSAAALQHPLTRALMAKITLRHGGPEFDRRYPEGIPTQVEIAHSTFGKQNSGLVMFPTGHARNTASPLDALLDFKFHALASLAVRDPTSLLKRLGNLQAKTAAEIQTLFDFEILN